MSLVGVTKLQSEVRTIDDLTQRPDVRVFCVEEEVGEEFARDILMIPDRMRMQQYDVIESLLTDLLDDDGDDVALLDGVSAVKYLRAQQKKKGRKPHLKISLHGLMWYPNGIFLREDARGGLADRWLPILRKARMDAWRNGPEKELLGDYLKPQPTLGTSAPVVYPILCRP